MGFLYFGFKKIIPHHNFNPEQLASFNHHNKNNGYAMIAMIYLASISNCPFDTNISVHTNETNI